MPELPDNWLIRNFQLFVGILFAISSSGYIYSIFLQWATGNAGWKIYSIAQTGVMLVFAYFFIYQGVKQRDAMKAMGPLPSDAEIDEIVKGMKK